MNTNEDNNKKHPAEDADKSSPMDGLAAVAAAAAAIGDNNKDDDSAAAGNKKKKKKKKKRKQSNDGQQQRDGAQVSAARARRLEQNRRAAIESRRRKKVMIAELQRSVTFYTKANENLKKSNEELEESLLIAKQKLNQKEEVGESTVATEGGLKTTEEERSAVESSPGPKPEQQQPAPPPATIPATLASPKSPVNSAHHTDQAHFSAMQAAYENMGYPSVPAATAVDSDEYIQSLEQYALKKTAAANAATFAANTALRIASWHKMMKASGQGSTSDEKQQQQQQLPPESAVNEEK